MMNIIDYTIEHNYIAYLISVVSLFYRNGMNEVTSNVNSVISKVFYIIVCNIAFIAYIISDDNDVIDMVITLMVLYCTVNCCYDSALLYSTLLYIMSYVVGNTILYLYNPIVHAFLQETPYTVIYSVSLGVPYVNSVAIICNLIYECTQYNGN